MSSDYMVEVFLRENKYVPPDFPFSQEDLFKRSSKALEDIIDEPFSVRFIESNFLCADIEVLNYSINSTRSPLIMIADAGVFFTEKLTNKLKLFDSDNRLAVMGFMLLSSDDEVVDAGIENPCKSQPMFRRFLEPPNAHDLHIEDDNIYFDSKLVLIRRSAFDKVGGFNPDAGEFFMINFCLDVSLNGFSLLYYPEVVIYGNYIEKEPARLDDRYAAGQVWFCDKLARLNSKSGNKGG